MSYSEHATHNANILAAETTRQGAEAGASAAAIKAAELVYYRTLLASCVKNGLSTSFAMTAPRELGVNS